MARTSLAFGRLDLELQREPFSFSELDEISTLRFPLSEIALWIQGLKEVKFCIVQDSLESQIPEMAGLVAKNWFLPDLSCRCLNTTSQDSPSVSSAQHMAYIGSENNALKRCRCTSSNRFSYRNQELQCWSRRECKKIIRCLMDLISIRSSFVGCGRGLMRRLNDWASELWE